MRTYNRSFRAEDANGTPIAGAQVTLWTTKTGAGQITTGIQDLSGGTIAGGILVTDSWGYVPDFQDALNNDDVWAIGSLTGTITGVQRVLLEASSDDGRISALESFTQGPGGLDARLTAVVASRGQPSGIATLDGAGKVPTAQLPALATSSAAFNVLDYGATGNGTTDDAAAIQAALDAVAAGNAGARILIPPGTYLIGSELEIKSSVWLDLTPGATIKRGSASMQYMIRNFNSSYAPTLYGGRGQIRISGGVWDADGGNLTGSVTAIVFAHAKFVRVEGVTVRNVRDWHAVELNSTQDAVVRDCTFEGFTPVAAGRYISEAVQIDLALNSTALPGIGAGAYDSTSCSDILIQGCTVRALGSLGSFGCLTGSHSWADGHKHTYVRVIGNYAESLSDYMVNAQNWDGLIVQGNEALNCNAFAAFQLPSGMTADVYGCQIIGNRVRTSGVQNQNTAINSGAIMVVGQDASTAGSVCREVVITGNAFTTITNPAACISTFNAANAVIQGNTMDTVNGTSAVGIVVTGSAKATISGNKMSSVQQRGISIPSPTAGGLVSNYANITGNTLAFINTGSNGASIAAIDVNAAYCNVTANEIVLNTTTTGIGFWGPATGSCCTGNSVSTTAGTVTGSAGIRNSSTAVLTLVGNFVNGWAAATGVGATGGNLWSSSGTTITATPETLNYINHAPV